MKIGIIGTGAYGVALAFLANKNKNDIVMWTENKDTYSRYLDNKCIKDIIPNISLSKKIKLTMSYEDVAKDKDIIIISSISKYVSNILNNIKGYISKDTVILIASKGLEESSCEFLSNIAKSILKTKKVACISGPTFAIDIVNDNPVGLTLASKSKYSINVVKQALESKNLKVEVTTDIIGVQLCGAIKNVIAIGSGILDGKEYPESTKTRFIVDALHQMENIIRAFKGKDKTINTYAGIGDLMLTCTSTKSRNFSFGRCIGSGKDKREYLNNNTVEGYNTLLCIHKLLSSKKIYAPLISAIYSVVIDDKDISLLIRNTI